jgi:hypothetical protein
MASFGLSDECYAFLPKQGYELSIRHRGHSVIDASGSLLVDKGELLMMPIGFQASNFKQVQGQFTR